MSCPTTELEQIGIGSTAILKVLPTDESGALVSNLDVTWKLLSPDEQELDSGMCTFDSGEQLYIGEISYSTTGTLTDGISYPVEVLVVQEQGLPTEKRQVARRYYLATYL